ncbi:signal peptidase I [Pelotomaculum sp. PtaB.Bin117]|uniref:signal peptidase I n=1 Tax=Pelotomaculum sp. PtaB.Bin117 TaxID=1811694 RepID=UPI0009C52407|nr:signal peptidase I [Pelotomaculum sp. PtaB.Bin117]OPX89158.1 MAG: Signal peptidase I W [Pelotomaculum sp. PtaB.Bin117]
MAKGNSAGTRYCYIILLTMLIGMYVIINMPIEQTEGSFFLTYVVQPFCWAAVVFFVWWLPRTGIAGKLRLRRLLNWLALLSAGFYIIFQLVGGMVEGFGKSPSSFTLLGITSNIVYVSSFLAGMEIARAYLIHRLVKRCLHLKLGLLVVFFTVLNIPFSMLTGFRTGFEFAKVAGSVILPGLAENAAASYLAYLGGPLPALIYRGALQAFQWFCPVLPDPSWTTKALLGTFIPGFSLFMFHRLYLLESRDLRRSKAAQENPAGWIITSVASVLLVWFSVGIFAYYPSVILSGSMMPGIKRGDIVLLRKITGDEVRIGDVIHFHRDKMLITHRVLEIKEDHGVKVFRTKGDNNSGPDPELVSPQQVKGKVIFVIPKIGWATLLVKMLTGAIKPGINSQGTEF